ncbi:MAG: 6-bladed beta-propeller [Porphyromonadaceae bacterium]|nr:MAG: 6-bladed beta-propeller [Porphyromonadaceae bacterium]
MKQCVLIMILMGALISCVRKTENSKMELKINDAEMINGDGLNKYIDKLDFTIVDTTVMYFTLIDKIIVDDSLLITLVGKERKEIAIVDKGGHLYGRIDCLGSGPGEYKQISDCTYNFKTKEIIVYDIVTKSLYSYNLRGQFKWQKKLDLQAVNFITDDQYYYFYTKKLISELGNGKEIVVLDKNCHLVNSFFKYKEQPDRFRFSADQVFSRNDRNEIFFSNVFRDTTYKISSKECVPYYTYLVDEEIPTRYTVDRDLYNNYFRKYIFHSGLYESTQNWIYFNVIQKGHLKDFYLSTDGKYFIETSYTQVSKNIYLNNPIGYDNQYFYYAILPRWIEDNVDEFYKLLAKYNRSDLISYFNRNLLYYNPIIVRVKFIDQ